ncbi:MAG: hypothetical protein KDD53_09980 [Bdellovibrionales bacterium]|nr:hypothetical protein [Bdellovibrionales bacterium]
MIFRGRKKHKLPQFPGHIVPTFNALCEALPAELVDSMQAEIDDYVEQIRIHSLEDEHVNLELCEAIAERCSYLLAHYSELTDQDKALAVGAMRYFIYDEDGMGDKTFGAGFDDDAKVLNHVLEELGFEDKFIDPHRF